MKTDWLNLVGLVGLLTYTAVFLWTYLSAALNDGQVLVQVNSYNEMVPEMILLILILPTIILHTWKTLKSETQYAQ